MIIKDRLCIGQCLHHHSHSRREGAERLDSDHSRTDCAWKEGIMSVVGSAGVASGGVPCWCVLLSLSLRNFWHLFPFLLVIGINCLLQEKNWTWLQKWLYIG